MYALPRSPRRFPNCIAWLDAAGNLQLEIVLLGGLTLEESALPFLQVNKEDFPDGD